MASILSSLKEIFGSEDIDEEAEFRKEFVYWWDDVRDEDYVQAEQKTLREVLKERQVLFLHVAIVLTIIPLLIVVGAANPYLVVITAILLVGITSISYIQVRNLYILPSDVIESNMELVANLDLTGNDDLLFAKEEFVSLQQYDEFRTNIVKLLAHFRDNSESLHDEVELTKSMTLSVYRSIDQINLSIDNTVGSTANFQETKGHLGQVSQGIDKFTENFDRTLDSIDEVTSILKSIGKQTTMLALNAGIEAAKAGSQGRGFEVVASNLRRLADHAVDSSNRVDTLSKDIQERARKAIEDITIGMSSLSDMVDSNHDMITNLNDGIFSAVRDLDDISRELNKVTKIVDSQSQELSKYKY